MDIKNILIVDDEKFVRRALTKELEEEPSFSIDYAASGEEAIEKATLNQYDLFFIDLVMPKMDGIETCKVLKKISPQSEFVCFTGIFDRILSQRVGDYIDAAGRTKLLYKPFRNETFLETARQILKEREVLNM